MGRPKPTCRLWQNEMAQTKKFIVVVYDISNDRRRTKLHDRLLDFGSPVQYSVFECLLDAKAEARMRKAVSKIIRPKVDQVRFYTLCAECVARVEITCGPAVLHDEQVIVVWRILKIRASSERALPPAMLGFFGVNRGFQRSDFGRWRPARGPVDPKPEIYNPKSTAWLDVSAW